MHRRLYALAAAAAAVFIGAAPRHVPLTVYRAPSGTRAAGASAQRPTAAILPDGRITAPVGKTIFIGTNPAGIALTPDGAYAIVADTEAGSPNTPQIAGQTLVAGYALVVVDTRRMQIVSAYRADGAEFSGGVVALADPRNPAQTIVLASDAAHDLVRVFDLSGSGTLAPEPNIALPLASSPGYARDRHAGPTAMVLAPDGKNAYVVESAGDIVAAIDIASRTALGGAAVGFAPSSVAASAQRVYVTDAGLSAYSVLSPPATAPRFAAPDIDPRFASSLATVPVTGDGLNGDPQSTSFLQLDRVPDGTHDVGGILPSAIALRADGAYAYVALSNVDRVAIVETSGSPRVVGGLDLRLFPNAPYGTQPTAEALAANGSRLYVALGGLNAVAVLDAHDARRLHRLGLIPTGWYPSALALSHDGQTLYVTDAKGVRGWGMLQRVEIAHLPLGPVTLSALRYNRSAAYARRDALVPPLRSMRRSSAIEHVVYVSAGIDGYDAVLGDLTGDGGNPHGNGAPSYVLYGASVTPNLHALAREFSLADNLYAGSDASSTLQLATAATVTWPVAGGANPQDPESYPRAGYMFNALLRAHETFRDYGALLDVSGYRDGLYSLDVPALAALAGNVDLAYASWNPAVSDAARAAEFVRDYGALAGANRVPDFSYVWLPTLPGTQAKTDRALGEIVDAISHTPQWASTAIFIVPDSFELRRDHVDGSRIYAIVVSPYARRGFVDSDHLWVPSVVKTEEEILGLPPLATDDLLATDLAACFTDKPDAAPYGAVP
ncbi:MAG: bifunctional YncE family protein/alkaline phosphatase family protein [Candidatus Tyrphobacter sp.]